MKIAKLIPVVLFVLFGTNVFAQETPEFEIQGGYSLVHFNPARKYVNNSHNLNGGGGAFTYNLNSFLGLKAEMNQYGAKAWDFNIPGPIVTPYTSLVIPAGTYHVSGGMFDYLFGPQFKYHGHKIQPFANLLFGGARSNIWTDFIKETGIGTSTGKPISGFAMKIGGGVDYNLNRTISLHVCEFDYLLTRLNTPLLSALTSLNNQNNFQFSTGVVFNLGTRSK